MVKHALCRHGSNTGNKVQKSKLGDTVARVLDEAQHCKHGLDMSRVQKLEPAKFDEGNITPGQFNLKRAAMI
jgi:hypothetical protein